ncbi:hypothetical protein OHP008_11680 [Helicobacter pylori]|uniref:hypothetical protein n=1 Tax=Helicobacter pylori TaxID=210 RepID=UPI001CC6EA35|nr:hypothetical protein [Helicobacter pylori]BDA08112.1 hypothetical protein OHP008_07470 [Helicobacter pylori]BDA08533.1 hypothetical protein OHP008_11680 [Helicobacter pylori]
MEKDLINLINVAKGLHDRLDSKAWKGKITINIKAYIEALFDLGDYYPTSAKNSVL